MFRFRAAAVLIVLTMGVLTLPSVTPVHAEVSGRGIAADDKQVASGRVSSVLTVRQARKNCYPISNFREGRQIWVVGYFQRGPVTNGPTPFEGFLFDSPKVRLHGQWPQDAGLLIGTPSTFENSRPVDVPSLQPGDRLLVHGTVGCAANAVTLILDSIEVVPDPSLQVPRLTIIEPAGHRLSLRSAWIQAPHGMTLTYRYNCTSGVSRMVVVVAPSTVDYGPMSSKNVLARFSTRMAKSGKGKFSYPRDGDYGIAVSVARACSWTMRASG
ncbi:MAG TPA: hypothetical protein DEV93_22640 [Chloroflexi bacterium]|nr:hypothetical protein [Chloroflexota bacterium]